MVLPGGFGSSPVGLDQAQCAGSGPVVTVGSSGPGNDGNILWFVFYCICGEVSAPVCC